MRNGQGKQEDGDAFEFDEHLVDMEFGDEMFRRRHHRDWLMRRKMIRMNRRGGRSGSRDKEVPEEVVPEITELALERLANFLSLTKEEVKKHIPQDEIMEQL